MEISYKTILKKRNYRRLLLANMINRLGDSIDTIAFSWLVYAFTGEGTWAAIVFAVNKIPSVLFLPLAGAFVEKKVKKNMMIVCDLIRALIVASLLVCIWTNTVSLIGLLLFSFFISAAEAFRIPAGVSLTTQLLDDGELSYGVSLNVIVSMLASVIGTGIGGLIISCADINITFEIDVATFVLSIIMIALITHSESVSKELKNENSLVIFKEGLQYIRKRKVLIYVILLAVFANAIMAPIDSLQAPIVADVLGQDAAYLSLLNICLTIGVLLGGAVYPMIQDKINTKLLFALSCLFIAFLYLWIAFMDNSGMNAVGVLYYAIAAGYLFYGLFAGFLTSGLGIILMQYTEQEYMSRINTIFTALGEAVVPVASSAAGLLLHFWEINVVFLLIAAGIFLSLAGIIVFYIARQKA